MIDPEVKPNRSYVDPIFRFENSENLVLSVQIGVDAIYAAVLDESSNTYLGLREFVLDGIQSAFQLKEEFEKIAASDKIFRGKFSKHLISLINDTMVLIPEALYSEDKKKSYLEFAHDLGEESEIYEDTLGNAAARNIYSSPRSLVDAISKAFPQAQIRHASSPLIEGFLSGYKHNSDELVVLHVQYTHFEILLIRKGELHFFNSFKYTTAEDFVYYILFVFEKLGLSVEKSELLVYGEIESKDNSYELLLKYVRNVEFGKRNNLIRYSDVFDGLPRHFYYGLFQQYLCA